MEEVWKFWKETYNKRYGNRIYEVSNQGRVKINGDIVKFQKQEKNIYLQIAGESIHRVVA